VLEDARETKANCRAMTYALLGKFRDDSKTRLEFLTFIQSFSR
jgi:GTP cyclohydrolase I